MSQTSQVSAILPSRMRWIEIASTRMGRLVAAMPLTSPTWVPVPVQRTVTLSPAENMSSIVQWPSTPTWYTVTVRATPSGPGGMPGYLRVVELVVVGEELPGQVVAPPVAHLLEEPADHGLFWCSHCSPPECWGS